MVERDGHELEAGRVPHYAHLATAHPGDGSLRSPWIPSLRIALAFFVVSLIWIPASDAVTAMWASNEAELHRMQTIKGWIYIAAVTGLLFFLISRSIRAIQATTAAHQSDAELLQGIFDSSPTGLIVVDEKGNYLKVNHAFADFLGYPVQTLIGMNFRDVTVPEDLTGTEGIYASLRSGESGQAAVEKRYVRADGTERWALLSASRLQSARGRGPWMVATVKDITVRKQREESLHEALAALQHSDRERRLLLSALLKAEEAERQRLAADVHDDTLQVLAGALMRLDLVGQAASPEQARRLSELATDLRGAMKRLRALVFELRPAALDQGKLAVALERYLEEASRHHPVTYDVQDLTTAPLTPIVRQTAYRIVREALANALKHARARKVTVCLKPEAGGLLVTVVDDGNGFDVDSVRSGGGRNLGLPLMEEKTRLVGGWIRFSSQPGEGTVVDFWVPGAGAPPDAMVDLERQQEAR